MPYYSPLIANGCIQDLAHLDPLTFSTPSEKLGRDIKTWCRFTTHAFSREPEANEQPDLTDEGNRPRVFCPDRHRLSFHLPGIIRQLAAPTRYVWQTATERNWMYQAAVGVVQGNAVTSYLAFFDLKKARKADPFDVVMTVESAYPFDPSRTPKLHGRMVIAGLLLAIVEGRKPHTQGARKH